MDTAHLITSSRNPLLKEVRKAVARGTLTEDGCCVAEGPHLLEEALRSGCDIRAVIASHGALARLELPAWLTSIEVEDSVFSQIASTETAQGVIALVKPPVWNNEQLFLNPALTIVIDGIQDPGNAGAILRVAEAFAATGVIFLKGSVSPFNPKAIRASTGSLFRLPVSTGWTEESLLHEVSHRRLRLYATAPAASQVLHRADCISPAVFLIGSEGAGVRPSLQAHAQSLRIETAGVESLNAATAAGIVLYECWRQRSGAR